MLLAVPPYFLTVCREALRSALCRALPEGSTPLFKGLKWPLDRLSSPTSVVSATSAVYGDYTGL